MIVLQKIIIDFFLRANFYEKYSIIFNIKKYSSILNGCILDIGCGQKPYEKLFSNVSSYTGLELESSRNRKNCQADIFYNGNKFPFEGKKYDGILLFDVIEHVIDLESFFINIIECMHKDSKILITVPFMWFEHEVPFDYRRFTKSGLVIYLEKLGIKVTHCVETGGGILSLTQLSILEFKLILSKFIGRILSSVIFIPFIVFLNSIAVFRLFKQIHNPRSYNGILLIGELNVD